MEFKVFDDKSGAFVFTAPGPQEMSDKFDRLVEAFEEGQIHQKRMANICENMIRDFRTLLRPYHILATIQFSKRRSAKALETAKRGMAAVHHLIPDDFAGPFPWHHDGNRPYLALLKTVLLCYVADRKYAKAADWCDLIRRADPDDSCGMRFVIGHALLRAGEHDQAQSWFVEHGTDYAPYLYELGLSLFRQERLVEAATAFRRGIAINPYIAEMIFYGYQPNPYPVMHFWPNEKPPLAKLYLGSYGALWEDAIEEQRFLYWLFNQSCVLAERAQMMACREQRSIDLRLSPPDAQVEHYRVLVAAIDDKVSNDIVRRRPNGDNGMEWPWQIYG